MNKMRKFTLILSLAMVVTSFFTSCTSTSENYSAYQCPMKCEGSKTYDKAGVCPVCNMDLEGIESKNKK